ncbi:hypothetical protein M902_1016 [Bacteriovorax sp. BAL6_X]|uniref:hypothetical protein n=1 Tax=Bacteriovorax sp. BAL6_X TaxID=1201290 RepID=UPI0003860460|nr:hypothetical protein [Bacteriovorax sp. BAL6_X]EPZ49259.1 hypothetical protein M902_1016 [Bacteriovorax sp. BAL6_X]
MKKLMLATALICSFSSFANELDLNLEAQAIQDVEERYDESGLYYNVRLSIPIIPSDITGAVGYQSEDELFEVEAYAGVRAIRYLNANDKSLHIPYGARVRVALDDSRSLYLEYQREEVADLGNDDGLLEKENMFSLIKYNSDKTMFFGCGVAKSVHHAWSNENHSPEDSTYVECNFGRKF